MKKRGANPIVWTEAHNDEAVVRTFEVAAELWRAGRRGTALDVANSPVWDEQCFRRALEAGGFNANRIEREVRRVHAFATATPEARVQIDAARADHERMVVGLATGRRTRETGWAVRWKTGDRGDIMPDGVDGDPRGACKRIVEGQPGRAVVRVTRIRKVEP